MASSPYCLATRRGKGGNSDRFPLLGSKITVDGDCSHEVCWWLLLGRKAMTKLDNVLKNEKQRHYPANKGPYSQGYGLPSGHVLLWELDHIEGRVPNNCCLRTVVLEKTPESPLDIKEIKPVNFKGDQPWIFTGNTDSEAEAPGFWSSAANRWLIGKAPDAGKDCRWEERGTTDDEMIGWHHQLNGRELE